MSGASRRGEPHSHPSAGKRRRDDGDGHSHYRSSALHHLHTNHASAAQPPIRARAPLNDDEDPPPARLSRHIPQRDEMDMQVSAFNLTAASHSSCTFDAASLTGADSFTSNDDSAIVSSLYCERLAGTLVPHGSSSKLGGDVLCFRAAGGEQQSTRTQRVVDLTERFLASRLHQGDAARVGSKQANRTINTNPDRVLDAPDLPSFPSAQLLHWGANNKLIIGLRSTLYSWDAETLQAQKALDVPPHLSIRCVQWIHRCLGIAITVTDGTTAILDTKTGEYVRTIRPPEGSVSQIAVEGATLALGSNTESGNIFLYDVRTRDALVAQHEGHRGRVSSLQYCGSEPHYLASGGADGCVRVWDARKPGCPRYAFRSVHRGAVNAVHWNPDRRTTLYSGGEDRALLYLDTHATTSGNLVNTDGVDGADSRSRSFILRSVNTGLPISGILAPSRTNEIATSHTESGQIQLRQTSNFQSIGVFSAPNCERFGIRCITLAPDRERVCAAQDDETLKFWKVFDAKRSVAVGESRATARNPSAFDDTLR